jgi:hypothetical protein
MGCYHHGILHEGEPCLKLLVPRHGIWPSLRHFHIAFHRGYEPLYEAVSSNFHWDGIKQSFEADCMVSHR